MPELLMWTGFAAVLAALIWRRSTRIARERERHIANHVFPGSVARKVRETYPHLEHHQVDLVISGLREFFSIALAANGRMVAMPSKIVDVAWHEFIVCTRAYQQFCMAALGYFLHHTALAAGFACCPSGPSVRSWHQLRPFHVGMHPERSTCLGFDQ